MEFAQHKKINTLDMIYISIGTALIAVCSWITVPMTVPFTLQTFAVFVAVLTLGGERGTLSALVYMLMGAVGVPVFSGFRGGISVLLGNTGGYIIGFAFIGLIYAVLVRAFGRKLPVELFALVFGLIVCYAFGTAWFMFVYIRDTGAVGLMTVLSWCVFPFIIPDIAKMVLAYIISKRVRAAIMFGK